MPKDKKTDAKPLEEKTNVNSYLEVKLLARQLPTKSEVISELEIFKKNLEIKKNLEN
ncbi:hypothetical protein [Cetobacterium sp.]|uniref:hypothetical protein n=1 Tax=Cetobacterium sp. TaxID=2071632 RepID=UPI003AF16DE9